MWSFQTRGLEAGLGDSEEVFLSSVAHLVGVFLFLVQNNQYPLKRFHLSVEVTRMFDRNSFPILAVFQWIHRYPDLSNNKWIHYQKHGLIAVLFVLGCSCISNSPKDMTHPSVRLCLPHPAFSAHLPSPISHELFYFYFWSALTKQGKMSKGKFPKPPPPPRYI